MQKNQTKFMNDVRQTISFIDSNYNKLFTIKDGDRIKFTSGYDGEVKTLKCRFIDEAHTSFISKSNHSDDLHYCEWAGICERNGHKCEPIPDQQPALNILAAKYGETLQDVEIPMTEAAIKKLVGGKYDVEELRGGYVLLRGKTGAAVCKSEDGNLTAVQPYWANTFRRELGAVEPPKERESAKNKSILGTLNEKKARINKTRTAENTVKQKKKYELEV